MGLKKEDLEKLYQGSLLIVFKEGVSEEERQELINKLYIDNEDKIETMQYIEGRLGTNMSSEWFKFRNEFGKGKKNPQKTLI